MMREFSGQEIRSLSASFRSAVPFRHVLVRDFLRSQDSVRTALENMEFSRKDTDLFSFSQTRNLLYKTPKALQPLTGFLSSATFSQFMASISGIRVRPGAIDLSGALYESTDYLLCHDDDLEYRKIAYIIYLSESFSPKDGGALVLYTGRNSHPHQKAASYPPLKNSLMMFEVSKKSWHEIEEVIAKKKRYTVGGWLH